MTERAKEWIVENRGSNFFLVLHYWDTHIPYFPPQRYLRPEIRSYSGNVNGSVTQIQQINAGDIDITPEDIEQTKGLYEGGVLNVDNGVGEIVKLLRELNLFEATSIIVTADHGSHLGEHGFIGNGRLLYDYDISIPLIISGPIVSGTKGKKIDALVSNCDIFTSIIENFGFEKSSHVRGEDMLSLVIGEKDEVRRLTYSETLFPNVFENKRIAIRSKDHKMIREPFERNIDKKLGSKFELLKMFVYRYRKNKGNRALLRKKLWDKIIKKQGLALDNRIEQSTMSMRGEIRELYDLFNDKGELRNLYYMEPALSAKYEDLLRQFLASDNIIGYFSDKYESQELNDRLKALGYL